MRRALQSLWSLPWPSPFRRLLGVFARLPIFQALLIPHFCVGVVGLIRNGDGDVLVLHHTYRNQNPWGLPTGFLEHGEQPADALQREIREETGLSVSLVGPWMVYTDDKRNIVNIVFLGKYAGGEFVPSNEIDEARFSPVEHLPKMIEDQSRLIRLSAERNH